MKSSDRAWAYEVSFRASKLLILIHVRLAIGSKRLRSKLKPPEIHN